VVGEAVADDAGADDHDIGARGQAAGVAAHACARRGERATAVRAVVGAARIGD
jgi:hypothetical protein